MGNQDRPPPDVERLEPRLTLSTLRPLRQRAGAAGPHGGHGGVVAETRETPVAPLRARLIEVDVDGDAESADRSSGRGPASLRRPGFQPPSGDDANDHGASGLHAVTEAQTGQIAFAGDHDPGHYIVVPVAQANVATYASTTAGTMSHDGPDMPMGSGMSSRVVVTMAMNHPASAMSRMIPTRDSPSVEAHRDLEPEAMPPGDELPISHAHDLDPGLEPELSPGTDVDITPAMVLRDAPGIEPAVDGPGGLELTEPSSAPRGEVHSAGTTPDVSGPRVAAVSAAAVLFLGNEALGRFDDDPAQRAPAETRASLIRRLCARLRRLLRARQR